MAPTSRDPRDPRDSPARRQRKRKAHQRTDSNGDLLPRPRRPADDDDPPSPTKHRQQRRSHRQEESSGESRSGYSKSNSIALSSGQLAQLDKLNQKLGWNEYDNVPRQNVAKEQKETRADPLIDREKERREMERDRDRMMRRMQHKERKRRRQEEERAAAETESLVYERPKHRHAERRSDSRVRKPRVASGQVLERGSHTYYNDKEDYRDDIRRQDGGSEPDDEEADRKKKKRRKIFIGVGVVLLLLAIIIPVAIVVSKNKSGGSSGASASSNSSSSSATPSNSNLNGISESSIPAFAQGTYLDPFTWYDTTDFNVTFTNSTVGGLSIMGLNSTWDDSKRPNDNVPALNEPFQYGTMPIRGVNIGGWLSIEPFITPSLFSGYSTSDNIVDEWTLTTRLGPAKAKSILEQHYSSFVNEQTFADIQAAGFDHVRIPFSYWAITTYDGDPYVPLVSWRYLLRGIEWARKYGIRINLDLHGAPGSQNGWNHSGHQGEIGWLNGTDGTLNGDRTVDIHTQLAEFFTQPRYKNIITMYGLVNEPRMTSLDTETVLTWSQTAITAIRGKGFAGILIFGDGFMGLDNWQGKLQNEKNLLLDVHQYVIFNTQQIVLNHHDKINFACGGWTQQALRSENTATGFGPTLCGEWSQADTDCATYLNNVGVGSRWEGTLNMIDTPGGSGNGSVLAPTCPTENSPRCQCSPANAEPSTYSSEYKAWLLMFAEAQMHSFEQGWGWFYWTWQTESATQWSYKDGMAAGILPSQTYTRDFNCTQDIPDYSGLGLPEYY